MSQGQNPAPPVKVTSGPSGQQVIFSPAGNEQSANPLTTVTATVIAKSAIDPTSKTPPSASVHGAVANAANVSIIFSSDGR